MARRKFIDIGANLTDPIYRGIYHGKHRHQDDFVDMIKRASDIGMSHVIITGGSLHESEKAIALCKEFNEKSAPLKLSCTVGCHPTRSSEFAKDGTAKESYLSDLAKLISDNGSYVSAIGEFGLDYDRLHFSDKNSQSTAFEAQFKTLVQQFGKGNGDIKPLPLFLHCRAAEDDFFAILHKYRDRFINGVVHSFTGNWADCQRFLDMGLYIGINGCSLKTDENINVTKRIPLDRLMLETDAPYCEIRASHSSHKLLTPKTVKPKLCHAEKWQAGCLVRGRNEPCKISEVFEVVSKLRCEQDGISEQDLADLIHSNTLKVFENLEA